MRYALCGPLWAADFTINRARDSNLPDMVPRTALAFGAAEASKNFTIDGRAFTHTLVVELPNWTNDSTATLSISDPNGKVLYSIAGLTENTGTSPHILLVARPVVSTTTITLTLSGVPGGAGGTAYVTIYLQ